MVLPYGTGPFPVLKTVTAPGLGAGGSRPPHGDRTERSNDLREPPTSPRVSQQKNSLSQPFFEPTFSRWRGLGTPPLLLPVPLKISLNCLYSADFPLVPFQRELRWKSIHPQNAPFQVPLGLVLTWKVPGRALPPPAVVCSCHRYGFFSATPTHSASTLEKKHRLGDGVAGWGG